MRSKVHLRNKAVRLRKQGKSYSEIQKQVPVSKGTLSKWFVYLPLTKKEARYLHERSKILQDNGRLKVAKKNRQQNEARRERIRLMAKADFLKHKDDPFFTLGVALYWSEGAKSGNYFNFINSDIAMMKVMLRWTEQFLPVEPSDYQFRLYLHKTHFKENCERFWSRQCAIPLSQFRKTIYKSTPSTFKNNPAYKGSLRLIVPGIDQLLRLQTWQKELSQYYVETH